MILAELFIDDTSYGPHLFWTVIATHAKTSPRSKAGSKGRMNRPTTVAGVTVESLPEKTTLLALDNASIRFEAFRVPASALLDRFGGLGDKDQYVI